MTAVSEEHRLERTTNPTAPAPLRPVPEAPHPLHLVTGGGGVATMRLAQALLAGYCAKLPGSDR